MPRLAFPSRNLLQFPVALDLTTYQWANFVIRNFEDGKLYRFQLAYGGDLGDYEIGTAMYVEYIVEDHEGEIVCMCLILSSVEDQDAYVARREQRESYE